MSIRHATRRARELKSEGKHTGKDSKRLRRKQNNKCLYCGCNLENYHVDHFIPLSKEGKNSPDNLVISCPTCNCSKNDNLPQEWYKWNGAYPVEWEGEIT